MEVQRALGTFQLLIWQWVRKTKEGNRKWVLGHKICCKSSQIFWTEGREQPLKKINSVNRLYCFQFPSSFIKVLLLQNPNKYRKFPPFPILRLISWDQLIAIMFYGYPPNHIFLSICKHTCIEHLCFFLKKNRINVYILEKSLYF